MNHTNLKRIRTVSLNPRGQIVILEDIRKDFGLSGAATLVIIEKKGEIVLRKESDVLDSIEGNDNFWKVLQKEAIKNAWSKEDDIWDKFYKESSK